MGVTREIMGVPYVFAKKNLRKPYHEQPVELRLFPAVCPNKCGLIYLAPNPRDLSKPKMSADNVCPDCSHVFQPHQIGTEREPIEVLVKMQFGNLVSAEFLRAVGPSKIVTAPLVFNPSSPAMSTALVTP